MCSIAARCHKAMKGMISMQYKKVGLLTCCVFVLGLSIGSVAAHAEAGAKWLILNAANQLKTGAELPATLEGQVEGEKIELNTKVLGFSVSVLCTSVSFVGIGLEGTGSLTNGGKVRASGCTVDLNGRLSAECAPHSPGMAAGVIKSNALKGLLVLIGGFERVLVVPKEGETLADINMGAECPIGEDLPFRGKFYVFDCEEKAKTLLVSHLVQQSLVYSDTWVLNKTAEHDAGVLGSAFVFLAIGEHFTLKWSGSPA